LKSQDVTNMLSRNVGKKLPYSLRNNPEDCSSHLFLVGNVNFRTQEVFSLEEVSDPVTVHSH